MEADNACADLNYPHHYICTNCNEKRMDRQTTFAVRKHFPFQVANQISVFILFMFFSLKMHLGFIFAYTIDNMIYTAG